VKEKLSPVVTRISFCRFSAGGILNVNVSEGVLPAQPLVKLRYRTKIERAPVFARVIIYKS
jgi:hypothetical protein